MMPNMHKMDFLVLTLELLGIPAQNQDGVLSDINTQSRVSILVPR